MAHAPPTEETLPVPADSTDTYIRIQPATDPLDPDNIETHTRRLHRLDSHTDSTGFLGGLFQNEEPPTIEWLLIGNEDELSYYVRTVPSETLDGLEGTLRGLFPNAYAFERVQLSRAHLLSGVTPETETNTSPTAIEYERHTSHRRDWQTRLTPVDHFYESEQTHLPLTSVTETIANSPYPVVFQTLIRAKPDWSTELETRQLALEDGTDTLGGTLTNAIFGAPEDDVEHLTAADEQRLRELTERDPRHSFDVNCRAAVGPKAANETKGVSSTDIAHDLETAFTHLNQTTYELDGQVLTGESALDVVDNIEATDFRENTRNGGLIRKFPWANPPSPVLITDASEVGSFCLLDGAALTASGRRLLNATPGERQPMAHPPVHQLTQYRTQGLPIGHPLTQDSTPEPDPISLPPDLQSLHLAWFGKTGSGKSTSLINALLDNHEATDGADILIDPKGDGMPVEYMQAHYERYGSLENVLYFDCADILPAFSFFDIRDELDAGISRTAAVEDRVEHYIEILVALMGRDRFEQAVRSPDIIRYIVKAMFDPVSGEEAFSHREFHGALQEMHDRNSAPPVSDGDLERMLAGVVANRARTFDEIMQGVANRIEKIPVNPRLARIFNHVPERGEESDDPHFDLFEYLDEDVVIIFDTGGLRSESQRALTLLIISNLWSALKRRAKEQTDSEDDQEKADLPLVNCYLEEAASIADSSLLSELLSQSRSFECSVTLAMQFPSQLRERSERAYQEVLNNVSTIVTGNVAVDERLAKRLATDEMSPSDVGNRLRALRRGEWLVSLPAAFDEDEPQPFLVRSLTPPRGHPAAREGPRRSGFEDATTALTERIQSTVGLSLVEPSTVEDSDDEETGPERVDSALPYTNRLPETVRYDGEVHALFCTECESRYDPDGSGMSRAIECCAILEEVDRDDVPICEVNLKLTPDEREVTDFSDRQLMFVQAVYNAQQLRYDPLEYDLLYDSMIRLQEYLDIDSEAVTDLVEAKILKHDTDRPHRLYSVTPSGRSLIGEHYRKGVDYGHGKGDLDETSQHVLAVEVGRQYLQTHYVEDDESPVVDVVPYFELDEQESTVVSAASAMGGDSEELAEEMSEYNRHRIDVVGLDEDGHIRITLEAERVNHDLRRAVPEDFDKMAVCDPDEAIWVTMSHSEAHRVLGALNDPLEGEPRVEKTYADSTPASQFRIDTAGCTGMFTVEQVRDMIEEAG
ncbi:TraM recognition domain-containing protein [Haloarcula sp. S1CR25-12]|uniref:TraM recognition domain-containing protein n=1 Tax=Haloarcula saliterrae TaxID=2950534 RepID=A0ABU2FE80_9EURY|nr:TraM recognition domain-containing protein [Haloarcula sp. S1CR25-12]MDS0260558.1 TraM recognition domain-containing protein [Haloarcula sp. S1CR25-12]